jgi:hypothetical protein
LKRKRIPIRDVTGVRVPDLSKNVPVGRLSRTVTNFDAVVGARAQRKQQRVPFHAIQGVNVVVIPIKQRDRRSTGDAPIHVPPMSLRVRSTEIPKP